MTAPTDTILQTAMQAVSTDAAPYALGAIILGFAVVLVCISWGADNASQRRRERIERDLQDARRYEHQTRHWADRAARRME